MIAAAPHPAAAPAAPAPTPAMRRALRTLESARPLGLARIIGGFRGIAGFVALDAGRALVARKLARLDYSGRNPRLKITGQGRAALRAGARP